MQYNKRLACQDMVISIRKIPWIIRKRSRNKAYLLWPSSHRRENSSQLNGAQNPSVNWLAEKDPPEATGWSDATRDSPRWTVMGNSCSFTNKPASDPPSLDMSTRSSLISNVAFGVYNIKHCKVVEYCENQLILETLYHRAMQYKLHHILRYSTWYQAYNIVFPEH